MPLDTSSSQNIIDTTSYSNFIASSRSLVETSSAIALAPMDLPTIADQVLSASAAVWSWPQRMLSIPMSDAFFEIALDASLNGGYFYEDASRVVRQWNLNGSGSAALAAWLEERRLAHELPGVNLKTRAAARLVLAPALRDLPYPDHRLAILEDFSDASTRNDLEALLGDAKSGSGLLFHLGHARALAAISPHSFGADPFLKKAVLALQMTAYNAAARGIDASCRLPIPADYQIPRILHWVGAIRISDKFQEQLRNQALLDATIPEVMALRAAAAVLCADIAALARTEDRIVDGVLFTHYRALPEFKATSLPAMRCASMWF